MQKQQEWQYCKDIPARNNNNEINHFTEGNLIDSFNFKLKITGQTGDDGTKNVEIRVPLSQSYFDMVINLCSYFYCRSKPKCNICNN